MNRGKEGETTVICRCKNRAVVIKDDYWTHWWIAYVSPQEPWHIAYYKGRERVRKIELDRYGRLIDQEESRNENIEILVYYGDEKRRVERLHCSRNRAWAPTTQRRYQDPHIRNILGNSR